MTPRDWVDEAQARCDKANSDLWDGDALTRIGREDLPRALAICRVAAELRDVLLAQPDAACQWQGDRIRIALMKLDAALEGRGPEGRKV